MIRLTLLSATREWRNWQTRRLQVPVSFGMWGFKSPLAHKREQTAAPLSPAGLQLFSITSRCAKSGVMYLPT